MKKYINTVSAFQFYQLVRYSVLIIIGIVFTKSALTQSAIGEYETFVFLAGAVSFFWLNGLLKALLPISSQANKTERSVFNAFIIIQLLSLLAAAFLFIIQPFFSDYLLNDKKIPETGLLILYIVFGVPANLVEYYYLIKKQNHSIVIYATLSYSIQLFLVVLPPVLGYPIKTALMGLVVSALLRYAWLWFIFISKREIKLLPDFIREHLRLGGPLVIATFLSGSAQFVDGFIVTSMYDEGTFAIFRYGARELPLAMLLTNALSNAMLPDFAVRKNLKQNLFKLKKSITRLMHLLFPLTILLILISHPLFPVLFNPDFQKSATIFNIYLLLIISRLLLPQTILNGLKFSKSIMQASFLELVLNVSLSLVLVQFFGIAGIAFATFLAYLFEKIYLSVAIRRKLNILLSEYIPVGIYVFYSVLTMGFFIFVELVI